MNELTINLKTDVKTPLYEQIYAYIKTDIQNGKIPYGEKLPSTRALSRHLEVSRSTVELPMSSCCRKGMWSQSRAADTLWRRLKNCIG